MNTIASQRVTAILQKLGSKIVEADQIQSKSYGNMFGIYKEAKGGTTEGRKIKSEIEAGFEKLCKSEGSIPNTKAFASKIGWLAGLKTKQRVSDCRQLFEGAEKENISTGEDFSKWINQRGGIRATLDYLRRGNKDRTDGESDDHRKIYRAGKALVKDISEHASNRKVSDHNPSGVSLKADEVVLRITEKTSTGDYKETVVKLTCDEKAYFPKASEKQISQEPEEKQALVATLASKARVISATETADTKQAA